LSKAEPAFDAYATGYDEALNQGLSLSGEGKDYFAEHRILWTRRRLSQLGADLSAGMHILDYGCGTGSAVPHFEAQLDSPRITGVDVSAEGLKLARESWDRETTRFVELAAFQPAADADLAFTNGTFHHIPLDERTGAMAAIHSAVKPGGWFAFWENNPWSPAARLVMARIPFDRDAIMVWPAQARRLATSAGFEVMRTDFRFIFPKTLRLLRPTERFATRLPLGAQYLVLCRKPGSRS